VTVPFLWCDTSRSRHLNPGPRAPGAGRIGLPGLRATRMSALGPRARARRRQDRDWRAEVRLRLAAPVCDTEPPARPAQSGSGLAEQKRNLAAARSTSDASVHAHPACAPDSASERELGNERYGRSDATEATRSGGFTEVDWRRERFSGGD
jgi:hypothetical protein